MFSDLAGNLWAVPAYRFLLVLIAAEVFLVLIQVFWLTVHAWRNHYLEQAEVRFHKELDAPFHKGFADSSDVRKWIDAARKYPDEVIRKFIDEHNLGIKKSKEREILRALYVGTGLQRTDLSALDSRFHHERVAAIRQLQKFIEPEQLPELLSRKEDYQINRMLILQAIARVGSFKDLQEALDEIELSGRIMEQPIYNILSELDEARFQPLLVVWPKLKSPYIRKILLLLAVERGSERVPELITEAAMDPEKDIRIGACNAIADYRDPSFVPHLATLARDPFWEVRGQAAKAIGVLDGKDAIDILETMLGDESFWVRQNAAVSLSSISGGLDRLQKIFDGGSDKFAKDAARQEIERYHLTREIQEYCRGCVA